LDIDVIKEESKNQS